MSFRMASVYPALTGFGSAANSARAKSRPAAMRVFSLRSFGHTPLVDQRLDHHLDDRVSLRAHLIVGRILDGMRYKDAADIRQPERLRLDIGGINELRRCNENRRLALNFEPG